MKGDRFTWLLVFGQCLIACGVVVSHDPPDDIELPPPRHERRVVAERPTPLPEPHIVIGSCKIDRIIDADTADLSITRIVRVRFRDCWAPETHKTKHPSEKHLGLLAEQHLKSLIGTEAACRLEILPDGDEDIGDGLTFGRVVGNVYLERGDGRSLGEITNADGVTFPTKAELESYLDQQDALTEAAE